MIAYFLKIIILTIVLEYKYSRIWPEIIAYSIKRENNRDEQMRKK